MQVREIMTRDVETIGHNATLTEAARMMKRLDIGALPIWQEGGVVGMVTDRDIALRSAAEGKDPSSTFVHEVMTPHVYTCYEDDDIHEAAEMMEEQSIHRLLVLNTDDEPVGFVSLGDFAVKSRDERLAWEILEKISEPACPHR